MDNGNLLPVVSEDTLLKLNREILNDDKPSSKTAIAIKKENPCIAAMIISYANRSEDPLYVTQTGLAVYNLLRSQAEADELEKELKL